MTKFEDDMNQSQKELKMELNDLEEFVSKNENVYINDNNIHEVIQGSDVSSKQ